jgi:hypothetical protein
VLAAASRWEVQSLRTMAIESLAKADIPPIPRIAIGRGYDISAGLHAAFIETVERSEALSAEDVSVLQASDVAAIAEIREKVRTTKTYLKEGINRAYVVNLIGQHRLASPPRLVFESTNSHPGWD